MGWLARRRREDAGRVHLVVGMVLAGLSFILLTLERPPWSTLQGEFGRFMEAQNRKFAQSGKNPLQFRIDLNRQLPFNQPKPRKIKPGMGRYSKFGRKVSHEINKRIIQLTAARAEARGASLTSPGLKKAAAAGRVLMAQRGKDARQMKRTTRKKDKANLRRMRGLLPNKGKTKLKR